MKKFVIIICLLFCNIALLACPVCEKQQPKILKGVTHGSGPDSNWDYAIVWFTIVIVLVTLIYTIKWIMKPGEQNENHIKRTAIN